MLHIREYGERSVRALCCPARRRWRGGHFGGSIPRHQRVWLLIDL